MNFKLKPILNFPGYYAGSDGEIYSYWITGTNSRINKNKKPRKLKGSLRSKYLGVTLLKSKNNYISIPIHILVCSAFHGECPNGKETSHEDGNRLNNKPNNLRWRTRSENHKMKLIHGTHDRGIKNSRCKINKIQLKEIKRLLKKGNLTHKEIGKNFGLSREYITKLSLGLRCKYD